RLSLDTGVMHAATGGNWSCRFVVELAYPHCTSSRPLGEVAAHLALVRVVALLAVLLMGQPTGCDTPVDSVGDTDADHVVRHGLVSAPRRYGRYHRWTLDRQAADVLGYSRRHAAHHGWAPEWSGIVVSQRGVPGAVYARSHVSGDIPPV